MFRRALKHAALAVAMLLPTIAGVVASTGTAHADPVDWWDTFNGQGLAQLSTNLTDSTGWFTTSADAHPASYANCTDSTNYAGIATDANVYSSPNTYFAPGQSYRFCVDVSDNWTSTTRLDTWQSVELQIKSEDGTILPGNYTLTNPGGYTNLQGGMMLQMDANPFNGTADTALAPGWYQMLLTLTASSTCGSGCTSEGDGATVAHFGLGYFAVSQGYLFGAHPKANDATELTQEQASTGINKNMSLVRDYKPSWDVPSARVATWASQGKAVAWSAKPPSTWVGTTSPWAQANADTTTIKNQIQSLQNSANQTGGPAVMFYTVSHEPHDNASDTTQGWHGGASDRKCGSATDPAGGTTPCSGTSAEFKALYHTMRQQQQSDCNSTGGTTGTLGFPCSKVLITYIGVPSNMTPGTNVGDNDTMRPDTKDFDVFGGDVFNWGCFRKAAGTCTDSAHGGNNEWKDFETLVDDPTSNNSLLDLAAAYNKPVVITELGSNPGCAGSGDTANGCNGSSTTFLRDSWFANMDSYLARDAEANKYLLGYTYYHDVGTYDWRFIDTTAGGDVDNRGLSRYTTDVASTLYRSSAVGYTATVRPAADFYVYSSQSTTDTYFPSQRAAQRPRLSPADWVPRAVDFTSGRTTYSSHNVNTLTFGFRLGYEAQQDWEARGSQQFIEIDAEIPCQSGLSSWGNSDAQANPYASLGGVEGYQPGLWSTNIPAAAHPYEDGMFGDDCGGGSVSVGIGIGNISALDPNTRYYATVGTYADNGSNYTTDTAVTLKAQTGTMYDGDSFYLSQDDQDCSWTAGENSSWNNAIGGALLRNQASWCSWPDYTYTYAQSGQDYFHTSRSDRMGLETLSGYTVHPGPDYLSNQGFEGTTTGYNRVSGNGGSTNWSLYGTATGCTSSVNAAYDGPCYLQYNNGTTGTWVSLQQDVSVSTVASNFVPSGSVAVRCPTGGSNCTIKLAAWGDPGGGSQESRDTGNVVLPNDGQWRMCRLDSTHYGTGGDASFTSAHSTLRWELYNVSGNNLDVDMTWLGDKYQEEQPNGINILGKRITIQVGGVGIVDATAMCNLMPGFA